MTIERRKGERRAGRPRLSPDRRKDKTLRFRHDVAEIDLLYRIAFAGDTTVTEMWRSYVSAVIAASSSRLK